jgi:hypothetical protein
VKLPSLRDLDIYGRIRVFFIKRYLSKTVRFEDPAALMSWQPLYIILLKTAAAVAGSVLVYSLHPVLGGWLEKGFAFFKFDEIYNFQLPGRSFFDRIAGLIFLVLICYYGLYFLRYFMQSVFSSLVVSPAEGKIYYIKGFLVKTALIVFPMPETDSVALKQNALTRLLGIGTIVVNQKNGDVVEVRSLRKPGEVLRGIVSPETPRDRSGFAFPGE